MLDDVILGVLVEAKAVNLGGKVLITGRIGVRSVGKRAIGGIVGAVKVLGGGVRVLLIKVGGE